MRNFLWSVLACSCLIGVTAFVRGATHGELKSGIDRSTFDTSVKPGDDFFEYVNGEWIKKNPIPPEYSRWGAFFKLRDDNLIALHEILEELTQQKSPLDEERRKLRDFYRTAMDEEAINRLGASPLDSSLKEISKIDNADALIAEVGKLRSEGIDALFSFGVDQDEKQSDRYAAHLYQGGLGLPDRDYYVGTSDDSKQIRDKYREHVAKMFELLGDEPQAATAAAETVLRIETELAEKSRTPVQLRDTEAQYNKKTIAELAKLTPNLDWDRYWKAVEVDGLKSVIVGQPEFFERVNELLHSVSPANWRTYLRWHLVHSMAPFLSSPFENESFRFYSQELRGVKEMQVRWKRVIAAIDAEMGEALGKLYVEKHFPPAAKKRMDELVKNLTAAYHERLASREWMGEKTRKLAIGKLDAVLPKIGYPDKWRDYSALKVGSESYAKNVMQADAFESRYRIARLGKPVDRLEWHMTPPTVNAYYNQSMNEIVFPAGILQPPFFDMNADDAVNYGGIGAVIGHEITHGFDDQGSRFDAKGNLENWWPEKDRSRFTALTDKLVAQYDACVVLDNLHVNGKLTLGENIADLGGVNISYAAYQKSLGKKQAPVIDGFTGSQRFFIGFAQVWRGSTRDAELRLMIRTNPHSPTQFRATVPVSNVKAFYDAFDVKPGDKMYRKPADRVEVW
ncbi:MAG TPA: M13 family metallopeptidase [Lacipirellulaceae bacterium]|nr:M13 family metallopeptidase [Lacipirellulaceae bacterium]